MNIQPFQTLPRYTSRIANPMRPASGSHPIASTVRFGDGGLIGGLLAFGIVGGGLGTMIASMIVPDTVWAKTLDKLKGMLDNLKRENVKLLNKPLIKERDGKIGKQYEIQIGDENYKVTEFRESKTQDKGGFYSQPRDILTSFRMERIPTENDPTKVKLKYVASIDGPNASKPTKQVTYIDSFGVYETKRSSAKVIKRTEAIIKALQTIDGEQRVAHFFENQGRVASGEAEEAFFQQEDDEKTTPATSTAPKTTTNAP